MLNFHSAWGVIGIVCVALLLAVAFQLTPTARLKRRLRKTHTRVTSKARRPAVKLSVKTPKKGE